MDDMAVNDYSGKFDYVCFDDLVPKGDFSRFVVSQVKMTFKSFNIENERFPSAIDNKKSYFVVKMLSLILYIKTVNCQKDQNLFYFFLNL